nr:T9SS type A sorting domain-containing protein [Bacteroidota bacterium]
MTDVMQEYLINGGKIYIDCGAFFGGQAHYQYPELQELMDLFGVAETEITIPINVINLLSGLPGSICQDLVFTGSTQGLFYHIDKMTPNENGIAAFEEEDYGTVAVQGEGEYGQKTFCFSYALGKLIDGDEGTRDELMIRITEFFDLHDPIANFTADTTFIIEGDTIYFTDLSGNDPTTWEWEFEGGTPETSRVQNPTIKYEVLGDYDVRLIVNNAYGSDTILKTDYIHVSLATNIATYNSAQLLLYPNPAKDKLFISCNHNIQSVEILNIAGQVIRNLECNHKQLTLDLRDLPDGIYFCRVQVGENIVMRKIIKL